MKLLVRFSIHPAREPREEAEYGCPSPLLFHELMKRWPECKKEPLAGFQAEYEIDSPVLKEILEFLRLRLGKIPKWTRFPSNTGDPKTLHLYGKRIFDPEEIEEASYCALFAEWPIAEGQFNSDDSVTLLTRSIKRKQLGKLSFPTVFVPYCTGTLKQLMEKEDFSHLEFRSAKLEGTRPPADGIWQMWSDLRMPSMLNRIVDTEGADYKPGANKGCTIDELYIPFQLRYRKAEVERMGDFDVALTSEHFGNYRDGWNSPRMIVSKRFRKWCDAQKLKIKWTPISLE